VQAEAQVDRKHFTISMLDLPRLVFLDSVANVDAAHTGALIVTGSHGGVSAARFALGVPAWCYVFNDAGVGKDGAGVSGLALLAEHGQAAVTVAHGSARIGEAADSWDSGVVSAINAPAAALGLRVGLRLNALAVAGS
jgi:hypothetical protein